MIYLKLRQAGIVVNHKRFERVYAEARLQERATRASFAPARLAARADPIIALRLD